jgi:hypothetical protein
MMFPNVWQAQIKWRIKVTFLNVWQAQIKKTIKDLVKSRPGNKQVIKDSV